MLAEMGRGMKWTYASMAVSAVLQLGVTAATARLLTPDAFGLIAMANVVLRFGGYVAQMGVGRALIQRETIDDLDIRAAFTSSTALGALVAVVVLAVAPYAAAYYQNEDVVPIIRWLALTFVISGLSATAGALLQRQLRFRASGAIEVVSYAVGYTVPTLTLAALGFGAWSLVAGVLGQLVVNGVASYALTRHAWQPTVHPAAHGKLLSFGVKVSAISFLEFIGSTLDVLVIGRFGSAAQLGLYNRAHMLASLPTYRIMAGISKVFFPVLSAGRDDRTEFNASLVTVTRYALKLLIPTGVGMALSARELVTVVLGDSWAETTPVFSVLAPALALNLVATFPGMALEALGFLRGKAIVQTVYVALLGSLLVIVAASAFDLTRLTIGVALAIIVRVVAFFALALHARIIDARQASSLALTALLAGSLTIVAMGGTLAAIRSMGASSWVILACAVVAGGVVLVVVFGGELRFWYAARYNVQGRQ